MSQVPVQPLLPQHRNKCSEQRDQETCIHESCGGNDFVGWIFLDRRNCGGVIWDSRMVEGEEDGVEEGCRPVIGIGLELGLDVDDKGRADCGEQTRL